MNSKSALVVAIVLAILSALLVRQYVNKQRPDPLGQRTMEIIAAHKRMMKGAAIQDPDNDFEPKSVRVTEKAQDAIPWKDREFYKGQTLSHNVEGGDFILASYFESGVADHTLENVAGPGQRAMTLAVDQVTGVAGLLKPLDRVDVLCVLPGVTPGDKTTDQEPQAMTLLSNVKLWAIGSQTAAVPPSRASFRRNYSAVTVLVNEKEAEILALAQSRGNLILTQRSSTDSSYRAYGANEGPASMKNLLRLSSDANRARNEKAAGGMPR